MPHRPHRLVALSLAALALTLTGCPRDEAANRSDDVIGRDLAVTPLGSDSLGGWVPEALEWESCAVDASFRCATLQVPLDWDDTTGETIDLAVGLHPARGERIGALLTNPGGPGASGLDFLFSGPFSADLAERFDIVGWDPRGVGESTAFECDDHVDEFLANDPDPDDEAEQSAIDADAKRVADECATNSPGLSANVGTGDVARDLEALRMALAAPALDYVGFSYGTLIGLRYLELFPTTVRTMVLDGVVDPTQGFTDWLTDQTIAIDAAISRALDECDRRRTCELDDAHAAFDELQRRVERAPIPGDDGAKLGPAEFETGAVYASYEPGLWPQLTEAIAAGLDGDGQPMLDMAQGYYDFGGFAAYAAVECLDSPHPTGPDEYRVFADSLRELSPRIGGSVANELLPCAYWSTPPESIVGTVSGDGGPPILVLGNRGDAATPYENSVKIAAMLTNGHLVSNDGEGHTSYGRSACVDDAVHAYLIDLEVPDRDPDCR